MFRVLNLESVTPQQSQHELHPICRGTSFDSGLSITIYGINIDLLLYVHCEVDTRKYKHGRSRHF